MATHGLQESAVGPGTQCAARVPPQRASIARGSARAMKTGMTSDGSESARLLQAEFEPDLARFRLDLAVANLEHPRRVEHSFGKQRALDD